MMRTTGIKKYLLTGGLSAIMAVGLVLPASAAPNYTATAQKSNATTVTFYSLQSSGEAFGQWRGWNFELFQNWGGTENSSTVNQNQTGTTDTTDITVAGNKAQFASEVVKLVNQERTKAGLKSLNGDSALNNMALVKAKDMNDNTYFSHTSPTYGSPFEMMKSFGISYSYAGENIAKGQKTPADVVTAWMNSEGHRANILSANYTLIGVGYYNGHWVQEFVGR